MQRRLSETEADALYYSLIDLPGIENVKVYQRSAQLTVRYVGVESAILDYISDMDLSDPTLLDNVPTVSARATNEMYKNKILDKVMLRVGKWLFLPLPVRTAVTIYQAVPFVWRGLKDLFQKNMSAEIIHAAAVLAALLTGEFDTAASVVFLTEIGDILEEWTYKKSVDDLAQSLSLNVEKVWKVSEDGSVAQVSLNHMHNGDRFKVTMGNMIPLDGKVVSGEAMVNQAALTGEPLAVRKHDGVIVYAGTVLEEGELIVEVRSSSGETRYDKIVKMIENSENLAALTQMKAVSVADQLVPWTFGASLLAFVLTRDVMKAASVLMADFSCAVEVAMPIAVLSAMREAGKRDITVKGGKFLEAISEADTIVFDKTGTLTRATPVVQEIVAFGENDPDDMLRIAACLEEQFPHSLANAVVRAAKEKGLKHYDMKTKAEYIVAHGIASSIGEDRVVIGSYHFVFEDEGVTFENESDRERLAEIPAEYSHLYMAIGGKLVAVIAISDPIKANTPDVIRDLKAVGFKNIVMMTGDSEKTAKAIAAQAGITEFYAEVLPEDKARYVEKIKSRGEKVIMIGDGINDSPALSAADVGIAIKEGADIAQEIADVTISGSDLNQLVNLRVLSDKLMQRMHSTYVIGNVLNGSILVFGISGLIVPRIGAVLHNASTIGLCLRNMQDLSTSEEDETDTALLPQPAVA
ncbi:heavy metal translocating P-type ATPase [Eubacteriaceae bacterium RF-744-FAT-4]|uniref:Cd(2+)-exporting ATPase n=2 Tax=Pseudoramibacter porci TaxID=2606631 RepID=A0A7X2NED1_9FIRM|nr:heavy metal translocating P-type ATPase [Pseudoramibacter porci]